MDSYAMTFGAGSASFAFLFFSFVDAPFLLLLPLLLPPPECEFLHLAT
jgi:hypothetical protein